VCRHIGERDGTDAFGQNSARRSIALERIVESHALVRDEFGENVGGKNLCERAEPQQRILGRKLMGVGRGLAVSAEEDMIVANDDENHTGGAGLKEEVCAQSANGLNVGERCWRLCLRESRHEWQHEQEDKQGAREFSVTHSRLQFLGYRTERLFEDRNDPLFLRVANFLFADQPPRTRSAASDPTRLKASLATPGWNKGFGFRHVRGDYKTLRRLSGLIQIARRTRLDEGVFMRQPGTVNPPD
jgi:hypothetical protein